MSKHLMLDLETMAKSSNSAIVQIGACYFDLNGPKEDKAFIATIDTSDPDLQLFDFDSETLVWWLKQDPCVIQQVFHGNNTLRTSLSDFYLFAKNADKIWSHATFDFVIVQNAFAKLGIKQFYYRLSKDIRTLTYLAGIDKSLSTRPEQTYQHNALHDAIYQATYCAECLRKIKGVQHG